MRLLLSDELASAAAAGSASSLDSINNGGGYHTNGNGLVTLSTTMTSSMHDAMGNATVVVDGVSDAEDDDTEMVKLRPERPNLVWRDLQGFQDQTLLALNHMRRNRLFCDVTLQIGQHDIPAHRVVLAAASPYWMDLFTSEEDQPTRKEVELDGCGMLYNLNGFQKDALEKLVEYSYTSRLDVAGDQVKPVYMAAVRLKMERVAAECARFLLSQLDLSSCLDLRSMPGIVPSAAAAPPAPAKNKLVHANNGANDENGENGVDKNNDEEEEEEEEEGDVVVDLIEKVDEFIESNFERLGESREMRSLPRICIEILHLSKEEREQALAKPLCDLALDWIRGQWLEDESLTIDSLSKRRNLLFVAGDHTLQDCEIIEQGSVNDSDVIQDYKKENQHLTQKAAKKQRRQTAMNPAVKPSKPRELLYSRHINQDDHADKQAEAKDGWKVIACANLDDDQTSILAIVTIDRHLATFSIMQRVNRPSSPPPLNQLPPLPPPPQRTMSQASDLYNCADASAASAATAGAGAGSQEAAAAVAAAGGASNARSPKISRPPSIEKDLAYVSVAPMPQAKSAVGAACLNGKLVVCGGYDRGECLFNFEEYDMERNKWVCLPSMLGKRGRFDVASVQNGQVLYAVAGSNGQQEEMSVEKFDRQTQKWTYVANLPVRLSNIGVTNLDGVVYCVGGTYGPSGTKYCFKLSQSEDRWERIANMCTGRAQAAVCAYQGKIWVAGGCDAWNPIRSVEIYDPSSNTWKQGPPLSTPRRGCGMAVLKGQLIVVGGSDGTHSLCSTEIFDVGENCWKPGPTMTTCRTNVSVAVVAERLWAVGGFSGKVFLNTVEYLDPETTDEWTSFITLPEDMIKQAPRHRRRQQRSTKAAATATTTMASSVSSSSVVSSAASSVTSDDDEDHPESSVITFSASGGDGGRKTNVATSESEVNKTSSSSRFLKGEIDEELEVCEEQATTEEQALESVVAQEPMTTGEQVIEKEKAAILEQNEQQITPSTSSSPVSPPPPPASTDLSESDQNGEKQDQPVASSNEATEEGTEV